MSGEALVCGFCKAPVEPSAGRRVSGSSDGHPVEVVVCPTCWTAVFGGQLRGLSIKAAPPTGEPPMYEVWVNGALFPAYTDLTETEATKVAERERERGHDVLTRVTFDMTMEGD